MLLYVLLIVCVAVAGGGGGGTRPRYEVSAAGGGGGGTVGSAVGFATKLSCNDIHRTLRGTRRGADAYTT